jgi:hypothetical protein
MYFVPDKIYYYDNKNLLFLICLLAKFIWMLVCPLKIIVLKFHAAAVKLKLNKIGYLLGT